MKKILVNLMCLFIPYKKIKKEVKHYFNVKKKDIFPKIDKENFQSSKYWDERYKLGGNSGSGSYSKLAKFKADVINNFIKKNKIEKSIDFGSGDGNNAKLYNVKKYLGVDISENAIKLTNKLFKHDNSKKFMTVSSFLENPETADLTMSLDVIYHLIEDNIFNDYMHRLVKSSNKFIIIYSSLRKDNINTQSTHVKHREFKEWISKNYPKITLIKKIENQFPFDEKNPNETSFSDFYIFTK